MGRSTQLEEAAEDTLIPLCPVHKVQGQYALLLMCGCDLHDLLEGELMQQCSGFACGVAYRNVRMHDLL